MNPRADARLPEATRLPHLTNLSARVHSSSGADGTIAGANVTGNRPRSLLIRAAGLGLADFAIANPMPDPRLVVSRGPLQELNGDNWNQSPDLKALDAALIETGAFALSGRPSAPVTPPDAANYHAAGAELAACLASAAPFRFWIERTTAGVNPFVFDLFNLDESNGPNPSTALLPYDPAI